VIHGCTRVPNLLPRFPSLVVRRQKALVLSITPFHRDRQPHRREGDVNVNESGPIALTSIPARGQRRTLRRPRSIGSQRKSLGKSPAFRPTRQRHRLQCRRTYWTAHGLRASGDRNCRAARTHERRQGHQSNCSSPSSKRSGEGPPREPSKP
jgi:hypothetical protein